MLSINMRIFKTVLLITVLGRNVRCLPIADGTESKIEVATASTQDAAAIVAAPTTVRSDTTDFYDQRQNGTENYRIHVDGVVLVFAPVEALLLAGASGTNGANLSDHIGSPSLSLFGEPSKPSVAGSIHNKTDPAISKTVQR